MGILLFVAAEVLAVQLSFSCAQSGPGEFENCTTGCSLSLESLLFNSTIDPNTINRVYMWASALQSNGTYSASVVAIHANRTPVVCGNGRTELCALAASRLELHCADGREWTVMSEKTCTFVSTCSAFNSSIDVYSVNWTSFNCPADSGLSNYSCASPPDESASPVPPTAEGCKPGETCANSNGSSLCIANATDNVSLGYLSPTGQITVIAVGGGSVILNAVLILIVCGICCTSCKKQMERNGQVARNPSLFVTPNNFTSSSSPSSHNEHLVGDFAPHNVSTFRPAKQPVQDHEMTDTGFLDSRIKK